MSELVFFSPVVGEIPAHPLIPYDFQFEKNAEFLITEWGDILPPIEFSRRLFDRLKTIATTPSFEDDERVITLAAYLNSGRRYFTFNESLGCWELPMPSGCDERGHDSKNRARYPHVSISALGYKNQLAHRASMEVFMGENLPANDVEPKHVDHRCRNHACCNPYHLEAVSHTENNRRGRHARVQKTAPTLFQLAVGSVTLAELEQMTVET